MPWSVTRAALVGIPISHVAVLASLIDYATGFHQPLGVFRVNCSECLRRCILEVACELCEGIVSRIDSLLNLGVGQLAECGWSSRRRWIVGGRDATPWHAQQVGSLDQCDGAVADRLPLLVRARLPILNPLFRRYVGDRIPQNVSRRVDDSIHQVLDCGGEAIRLRRLTGWRGGCLGRWGHLGRWTRRSRLSRRRPGVRRTAGYPEDGAGYQNQRSDGAFSFSRLPIEPTTDRCIVSIAFSGDTNGNNGNLERLAHNVNLFVAHNAVPEGATGVERALHMPPSVIGKIASTAGVRQLVLAHRMLRTLGHESESLAAIRASYSGAVTFADDLQCFQVAP